MSDALRATNIPELRRAIAEAYVGRAMIYTMQGKDLEAQRNVDIGVDLGYDLVPAQEAVNEIKSRR